MRLGQFLKLSRSGQTQSHRSPAPLRARPASVWRSTFPVPCGADQLAYLGLCVEVNHDDPYAELDRLALLTSEAATKPAPDESWLALL
jgi:hypothetical protein